MSANAEFGLFNRSVSPDGLGGIKDGTEEVFQINVENALGSQATFPKGYVAVLNGTNSFNVGMGGTTQPWRKARCVMAEDCEFGKLCKCTTSGFVADGCYWDGAQDASNNYPMYISTSTDGLVRAKDLSSVATTDVVIGQFRESVDGDGVGTSQGLVDCFIDLR